MKKTKLLLISGFLGAGKTTFIKKYIGECKNIEKTVIIENEFGEVSIDGKLLKSEGIDIKEINSGCICCSLSGSFKEAMHDLKTAFDPDTIIIEPSGVAKLSEIVDICQQEPDKFEIAIKITIVDPTLYEMYSLNFGDFYNDQIANADVILYSRYKLAKEMGNNLSAISENIQSKNPSAIVIAMEWDEFNSIDLVNGHRHSYDYDALENEQSNQTRSNRLVLEDFSKAHICSEHHSHSDDASFDNISLSCNRVLNDDELKNLVALFDSARFGDVIRAKGGLLTKEGILHFDYVPGQMNIDFENKTENILVIIGKNLDRDFAIKYFN